MDLPSLRRETIYGMPAADQIMFNRHYVLGYSYYFRQAKWALEIISPSNPDVDRADNFRQDLRIPEMFRAGMVDYSRSGYDRGHLVSSANQKGTELQNSETFLLSNMSPQKPKFNRQIWKNLEGAVRDLNAKPKVFETYVICGPIFYFDRSVESIGADDDNEVTIPVPHAYFKSVLIEKNTGTLNMWSFVIPNKESLLSFDNYRVSTTLVEKLAGIKLWERLEGKKVDKEKSYVRSLRMW